MLEKKDSEYFVLSNGSMQEFPNFTEDENAQVVSASEYDLIRPEFDAQNEMKSNLDWSDIEIKKHLSGHSRVTSTLEVLYEFQNQCRDYVRKDESGNLYIQDEVDKPVRPD